MKQRRFSGGRQLPKFCFWGTFWHCFSGTFTAATLTQHEEAQLLKRLTRLLTEPSLAMVFLRKDWQLTLKLLAVRDYAAGRVCIFSFACLGSDCRWRRGFRLAVGVDALGRVVNYTVWRAWAPTTTVKIRLCEWTNKGGRLLSETAFRSMGLVACWQQLKNPFPEVRLSLGGREVLRVEEAAGARQSKEALQFQVSWYIGGEDGPWTFVCARASLAQTEAAIAALLARQEEKLGDLLRWEHIGERVVYAYDVFNFPLGAELLRAWLRAKREGHQQAIATLQAVGASTRAGCRGLILRLPWAPAGKLSETLFQMIVDNADTDLRERVCGLAYLALEGDVFSRHNLGWHLHFGVGVEKNYPLSIYWHLLAAHAGDELAMQNLGSIFTEKGSPVWDGPRGIRWLERAVAKSEPRAMIDLAYCLCCGDCVGKDLQRANRLLNQALQLGDEEIRKDAQAALDKDFCGGNGEGLKPTENKV